jgi:mitogen-activated protein kinase 7
MQYSDNFYTVSIENTQEHFTISKQYKLIRKVGSGSYGSVCSALNLNTNEGNSFFRGEMQKREGD